MLISLTLSICVLGSVLTYAVRNTRHVTYVAFTWSTVVLALGLYAGLGAIIGPASVSAGGLWCLDAVSGMVLILISFMQWTAVLASIPYMREEVHEGVIRSSQMRNYFLLLPLFVLSMFAATAANNLGVMWIALEATTLSTTLIVALYDRPGSLEAAWKYLILCSTGIALGLLGLLITFYAAQAAGIAGTLSAIHWSVLHANAAMLAPIFMKLAFILILIGYGTKAGLVPMHTWLPDAHSSAPSPVSGLLSGVLLPVALLAVLRFKSLADISLGDPAWTSHLLLIFGVLSCAVPAAFILSQYDYKRLLAYSSVEHMGLVVFSFALGGIGAVAGVIHLAGHALAKSALFFSAGNVVVRFKSTKFARVGRVATVLPITGGLFLIGLLFLLAMPPSPLFLSEYLIVSRGVITHPIATALVLVSLAIIAAGFVRQLMPFLFSSSEENQPAREGESWNMSHIGILAHLALLAALGIALWTPAGFAFVERIADALI